METTWSHTIKGVHEGKKKFIVISATLGQIGGPFSERTRTRSNGFMDLAACHFEVEFTRLEKC